MSGNLNKVMLIGRACSDPEVRAIPNGTKVANFTLATSESFKKKDGTKTESTEFHRLVIWGKLAEICESYVKKGMLLHIEGKNKTRKWTDKNNQDKYTTEIIVNDLIMLGGKSDKSSAPSEAPSESPSDGEPGKAYSTPESAYPTPPMPEDDLPF